MPSTIENSRITERSMELVARGLPSDDSTRLAELEYWENEAKYVHPRLLEEVEKRELDALRKKYDSLLALKDGEEETWAQKSYG